MSQGRDGRGLLSVSKRLTDFRDINIDLSECVGESTRNINDFFYEDDLNEEISGRLETVYSILSDTISVGLETIQNFLIPNIKYNSERTDSLRNGAASLVAQTRGFVLANEKIIDRNEKVTQDHVQKIESYRRYLREERVLRSRFSTVLLYIGQMGFLTLFFALFAYYLYRFRPTVFRDLNRRFVLFLLFLTQLLLLYAVTHKFCQYEYIYYLVPPSTASLLRITRKSRTLLIMYLIIINCKGQITRPIYLPRFSATRITGMLLYRILRTVR